MTGIKHTLLLTVSALLLFLGLGTPAWAVNISTSVDTHKVEQGDSLILTVQVNELAMGKKPDFRVLEDQFQILNTTTQQRTRIVNDQMESSMTWSLTLIPKATGYIVIPPIPYEKVQSKPITIQVSKRSTSNQHSGKNLVFIEASVDKKSVYVQEQLVLTLRLYRRTQIIDPSWTPPDIDNAVMERLTDSRSFQTTIDGYTYQVTENTFAVFPQKSGTLQIPESRLTAVIGTGSRGGFFFDPFSSTGKQIQRVTQPLTVAVKPIPASYPNSPWLPSRSVGLVDQWSPENTEFTVGEAVTRTIILQAKGITATALPTIPVPQSDKFKVYPDKADTQGSVDADGMVSQRVESYAFIPTEPGTVTLPEIQVHWWDVSRDELKTATLPSRTITVKGAAKAQRTDQTLGAPPSISQAPASAPPSVSEQPAVSTTWQWIALISTALWIVTLIALVVVARRRRSKAAPTAEPRDEPRLALKDAKTALKKACQKEDPAAARDALIQWGNALIPGANCHSIGDVSRALNSEKCQAAIRELEILLYRRAAEGDWDGTLLWEAAEEVEQTRAAQPKPPALAPLYPAT